MSGKIMVVGTGNVGASIAYAIINQRTAVSELILVDIDTKDAEGEAMDLNDALAVTPSWLKIQAGKYRDAKDCDICVLAAGVNQRSGSENRNALLQKNAKITRDIVRQVMQAGFKGIFIVVSNPVDVLTYLVYQVSGLPAAKVIGSGTTLDTARLRFRIATTAGVHPKSVHAYQIGEHGDSEFALWSTANIGGERLSRTLHANTRNAIEKYVRGEAYKIIEKKGSTHFGVGACVVQIINCILGDERRVLPVSNYDDCSDTYYGFPAVVGRAGVLRRIELDLSEAEGISLQKSINVLKENIKQLEKAK